MTIDDLKAALAELEGKTKVVGYQACHALIEKHRGIFDAMTDIIFAGGRSGPPPQATAALKENADAIPRAILDQQMAGYSLLARCEEGERDALRMVDEMIAALKEVK